MIRASCYASVGGIVPCGMSLRQKVRARFLVPEFYKAMPQTWLDTNTEITARGITSDFITSENVGF